MLRFIESLGYLAGKHSINGAHHNQENGIEERNHVGGIYVGVAHQQIILACRIMMHSM